ncbi:MAG: phospho-sugar mutase, partial [Erysipelotrichaceae bacterium]|nr:phospho-sugar mutase [Erysipelotrichaceae bacterium]
DELIELAGNDEEIIDAFYTDLHFGTSGLRGLMGPGTNRINAYVIRRATQGLANYLKRKKDLASVVISYDSRKDSDYFARETAAVLNGNGIKTYIFRELTPVSVLSFAIRELHCDAGVMITASHNPKLFNGYKVYNSEGYQIVGDTPKELLEEINSLDFFEGIRYKDDNRITEVPNNIRESFIFRMRDAMPKADPDVMNGLKTIYTPLNGSGYKFVKAAFKANGYKNYDVVRVQRLPDPEFTTCPVPNPEKILAYDEGFRMMDQEQGDIVIATDPDADRVGCALYHDGMRTIITGNQLGILLLDYLCHVAPPRPGQFVFKSVATSPLVNRMAERYGFRVVNTLTGFKYIGQLFSALENAGRKDDFYFAFEESDSYLAAPFLHEKDGISGSLLTVEMAAFHKRMGKDLIDRLNEIYEEFGVCKDKQRNYFFTGAEGQDKIARIMEYFRSETRETIGGRTVKQMTDYQNDETGLPKANVIRYEFEDGSVLVIRPSGTEAKLKVYSFETGDFTDVERAIVKIIEKFQ